MGIIIKSEREIASMRRAGRIVGTVLAELKDQLKPGMKTIDLDRQAESMIRALGGVPSFKGYRGFPGSLCVSVNEEIVHGIPGARVLKEGDIVSLDLGAVVEGFQGDAAITSGVGHISEAAAALIRDTQAALEAGIATARAGRRLGDVGAAIQQFAESRGYGVVREYSGHGIGREMHEDPSVPNVGRPGSGALLKKGMTLALEPMLNLGTWRTMVGPDAWTVFTGDGKLSAHFEHTIAINDGEAEVLTVAG
ncbi:methionine aminopeptidase, type I [Dehalogenimonas lykanthroporepellens BL-DC-9]|nr:methionine aminopeptidase, type I [Dehalogenimonas lykanthroporepellens BL-DC-9]